jgi:hypothetical protein
MMQDGHKRKGLMAGRQAVTASMVGCTRTPELYFLRGETLRKDYGSAGRGEGGRQP